MNDAGLFEILEPLRRYRSLLLAPLLGVLLSYAYFVAAPAWNQNSRLALTRALVERHTTIIDDDHETTGDKSFRDGHFYSDKAPGTSLLATIPYAALHAFRVLTRGELPGAGVHPLDPKAVAAGEHPRPEDRLPGDVLVYNQTHRLALWLCGLFAVALPSLVGAMAVFLLALRELGDRPRPALLVALTYAIATPAFPYSTVLYGHQPCAALLVAAFAVIALLPAAAPSRRAAILCGALLGLAVVTEYTAAVVVVLLSAWALRRHGPRFALHVIAGGPRSQPCSPPTTPRPSAARSAPATTSCGARSSRKACATSTASGSPIPTLRSRSRSAPTAVSSICRPSSCSRCGASARSWWIAIPNTARGR